MRPAGGPIKSQDKTRTDKSQSEDIKSEYDNFESAASNVNHDVYVVPFETVDFYSSSMEKQIRNSLNVEPSNASNSFTCPTCEKIFKHKQLLKVHIQTVHLRIKPYKCNQCDFTSARKSHLTTHKFNHTGEKPFKCSQCDFASAYKNRLNTHMKQHRKVP